MPSLDVLYHGGFLSIKIFSMFNLLSRIYLKVSKGISNIQSMYSK